MGEDFRECNLCLNGKPKELAAYGKEPVKEAEVEEMLEKLTKVES